MNEKKQIEAQLKSKINSEISTREALGKMKEKLMLLEQGKMPMTEWEEEAQKEKQVELKKLEGMKKVRKQKKRKRE